MPLFGIAGKGCHKDMDLRGEFEFGRFDFSPLLHMHINDDHHRLLLHAENNMHEHRMSVLHKIDIFTGPEKNGFILLPHREGTGCSI